MGHNLILFNKRDLVEGSLLVKETLGANNGDFSLPKPRLWTRNFIFVMLANLFIFISFQMAMPIIPLYSNFLGASQELVGAIGAAATFSAVLMRPLAGRMLDHKVG